MQRQLKRWSSALGVGGENRALVGEGARQVQGHCFPQHGLMVVVGEVNECMCVLSQGRGKGCE